MTRFKSQIPARNAELSSVEPSHFISHGTTVIDGHVINFDVVPGESGLLGGNNIVRYGDRLVLSSGLSDKPRSYKVEGKESAKFVSPARVAIQGFLAQEAADDMPNRH